MRKVIIAIGLLVSFVSCRQLENNEIVSNNIREKVTSGDSEIDIAELTDFQWDCLLILTPYTNPESIEEELDINLWKINQYGIQSRDDINLLLFLNENQVVEVVEYPRYPGDFIQKKPVLIKRRNAIFDIVETDKYSSQGKRWIELHRK